MGDGTHVNEDFDSGSPRENPRPTSYGVFSGSHHFTVAGGTISSTTTTTNHYHTTPTVPSDYRQIPMGDIDLQREIHLDKHSRVVGHRREGRSVRRVYSAKIPGRKSSVTVATYQGESAEEEWRGDVARYMAMRHPNIVQLCGTVSSRNIHATVFHDELIPFQDFVELHQDSHFSTVYIYAYIAVEFRGVWDYFYSTFQHRVSPFECTFFIRRSTGRICVDLAPGNTGLYAYYHLDQRYDQPEFKSLNTPSLEAAALDMLTLEEYHEICYWQFSQRRIASIYNPITVDVDTLISCSSGNQLEDFVQIAFLPRTDSSPSRSLWDTSDWGVTTGNGWTCLSSSDAVAKTTISLTVWYLDPSYWLSQANHIFMHLGISSNFEDYAILHRISFEISISWTTADPLEGFLFLCPPTDFQIGPCLFKWPDCPAYWSLDPTGAERLSSEDAAGLGFPTRRLSTVVVGRSWDASVYAGIRQFHRAKGFDPESQDVARHLGCPLYELSSDTSVPFAHIDKNFCVTSDGDEPARVTTEEEFENGSESSDMNHADANTSPSHSGLADALPVSRTLGLLIYLRLSLILGLVLSWLYEHVWSHK